MNIPVNNSWTLTFDEEFNGTNLNENVWGSNWLGNEGAITKPVNEHELGVYDPAQVSVSGGNLHLGAVKSPATVNGIDYQYRSGMVNTHDNFNQTHGYFEARINTPGNNGEIANWPAFWLNGENWPVDGELDIMEGLGGSAAYHFHSPSGGPGKAVPGDFTGWHTYGALWEPGKVSYFYDNVLVGTISSGITDSPMYLILNNGIGDDAIGGPISAPADMLVDWVRVYSNDTSAVAAAPQMNYEGLVGAGKTPPTQTAKNAGNDRGDILTGTAGTEQITGLAGKNANIGNDGNDVLTDSTVDNDLRSNGGAHKLRGELSADKSTDEAEGDSFYFGSVKNNASGASDFVPYSSDSESDRISLFRFDANNGTSDEQPTDFNPSTGLSGKGEYWLLE